MTKELVIAATRHETKVAVLEDDQLVEIYFQRAQEYSLAGSVHKGRVTRVLPGMQSAFVDLGLERDTFLYVSDFFEESDEYERLPGEEKPAGRGRPQPAASGPAPLPGETRQFARPQAELAPAATPRALEAEMGGAAEAAEASASTEAPSMAETAISGAAAAVAPLREEFRSGGGARGDRERRSDRPNGGDRGGRRGRRRRGRGRGFPESKYAEVKPSAESPGLEPGDGEEDLESSADFTLLPGESLAKYSRPDAGSLANYSPGTEEVEVREAGEPATAVVQLEPEFARLGERRPLTLDDLLAEDAAVSRTAAAAAAAEALERRVSPASGPQPEDVAGAEMAVEATAAPNSAAVTDESEDAAEEITPVDPLKDEDTGLTEEILDQIQQQAEAMAERVEAGQPASADSEAEVADEEDVEAESDAEPEAEAEADEESESEADLEDSDDEDRDIQEMVLEAAKGGEGTGADPAIAEQGEQRVAAGETDSPAGPPLASMESMAASPREQTSRFSRGRRLRRRRGGDKNGAGAAKEGEVRTVAREPREPREAKESRPAQPSITELLKEGQEIVVQIAKEPMGQKGARITSHIALPGRYCVYMPTVEHLGVSRKIASDEERVRLRKILQTHRQGIPGGFIIRTAGEGKTEEQIAADIQYLYQLWTEIKQKADRVKAPALLYHDVEIVQRLLRDQLTENFKAIWVDNEQVYESVLRFVSRMQPALASRVKLYTRSQPIFDAFGITGELEKALRPKVWLKSGGYIVINQTEALVAIDVNTGKFVGKSNRLEDTIVKTNIDAVKEIVRQIRLRDLGGIIVVDFIDMDERKNRQKVMQALEEAIRADRAPNKILQFNDFGLVAITRKRVKQSLERTLCAPCPTCEGSGYVKSVQTVIGELMLEAAKIAPHIESKEVILRVHPSVAIALKSRETNFLEELEEIYGRPVAVKGDETLHPEKFDIA